MSLRKTCFRWPRMALATLVVCGTATAAHAISINQVIGVDRLDTYSSAVFVGGSDGNVWLNTNYGGTYHWQNLTPLSVSFGVGVTSPGGNPAAYEVGTDGNLYLVHQTGATWSSEDIGTPPGVALREGVGVCSNTSNQPFVFLIGSDGNIWLAHYAGTWTWLNIGTPSGVSIAKPIGVVNVGSSYPQIFIIGSDGNVWHSSYQGTSYPWDKVGTPPNLGVNQPLWVFVGSQGGTTPGITVTASNGEIWTAEGVTGSWLWQQVPATPAGGVTFSIGVPLNNFGEPAVVTNGGEWAYQYYSGSGWQQIVLGLPGSEFHAKLPVGVIDAGLGPLAFYITDGGNLAVIQNLQPTDLGTP